MSIILIILFICLTILPFAYLISKSMGHPKGVKLKSSEPFPERWKDELNHNVSFYKRLPQDEKIRFEGKVRAFLTKTPITGVDVEITDKILVLVAASAVIPVFSFKEWQYTGLEEILLYKGMINDYRIEEVGQSSTILGQVRPFQTGNIMLLSQAALENGFRSMEDRENVGFHEFAHMIDKADDDIDGIPRALLPEKLIKPWTSLMYREINRIRKGKSDINSYGATSEAEFFAVVCEYFFENPEGFKKKHPELHAIMVKAFHVR